MPGRLQVEIAQSKPFQSIEHEAHLNLLRTTDMIEQAVAAILKPFGISAAQYNVLRILRGAGSDGLKCSEIGNRMIARDPDVTRLLDRLERQHFVARARDTKDRRVVQVRVNEAGLELLGKLDDPILDVSRKALGHLGSERLRVLIELLEEARAKA